MIAASRWTVLVRACLLLLGWGVALLGLSTVFARGPWQGWAMAVAACALLVAALLRVARPGARLVPCLAGLLVGAVPAVAPAWRDGRVAQWYEDPVGVLGMIRVRLVTGNAPVMVEGVLLDGILLACVVLVWAGVLLVVGLDAGVASLLVPAALLLVTPAVLGIHVRGWLVAAFALLVLAMVWVGAPPRVSRWRGGVVALVALVVAALVVAALPPTRDRLWNTTGVGVSPVSGDVPDVTVALGEDLRQGSTTEVFRFTGQHVGTPERFPLAVLADLEAGRWKPIEDTDATLRAQPRRAWLLAGDVSLTPDLSADDVREQYSATIETTGLVSSWLPLPLNAIEVTPLPGAGGETGTLDATKWSWVSGTTTARSTTTLTGRGTTYRTVGLPYLMTSSALRERASYSQMTAWPVAFSPASAVSAGAGADVGALAASLAPYLALPGDVPEDITDTAQAIAQGAGDRLSAVADLVSWFTFGDFTYDESAPYTPGTDAGDPYSVMEAFLKTRSGYCVHFASTFTVMARTLGIPTRLVVGYAARAANGWSGASARNLHAWPEVYFEGLGWVAFEPTPGGAGWRADTGSDANAPEYALPGASASASPSTSPDDTPEPAASPEASAGPSATSGAQSGSAAGKDDGAGTEQGDAVWPWVWVCLGVVVLLALVWVPGGVRRWRRRARLTLVGAGGPGAAGAAWAEFVDSARDLGWMDVDEGVGAQPRAHTPEALVEHLDSRGPLPGRARDAAAMLAGAVVAERFGGGDATVPVSTELANALDLAVAGMRGAGPEVGTEPERERGSRPGGGLFARMRRAVFPASVLRRPRSKS